MSSSKEEFLKNHSRDSGVLKTKNCKDHFQSICGSDRNKTASPTLAKPFCANHIESGIKLTLVNCKKKSTSQSPAISNTSNTRIILKHNY